MDCRWKMIGKLWDNDGNMIGKMMGYKNKKLTNQQN